MIGSSAPRAGLLEEPADQAAGDAGAAPVGRDRDVHQVPDLVVAGADQVAEQLVAGGRGEADAGGLGELEHEHRQRPRRRERAPLDRDHRRAGRCRRAGAPPAPSRPYSVLWEVVSLTPTLRVGRPQVDRGERPGRPPPLRGQGADVAGGDSVHGIAVVRHLGSSTRQLITKSYRPGSGGQGGVRQLGEPLAERLRGADPGAPEPLARGRVERGEDLAAAGVEHRQPRSPPARGAPRRSRAPARRGCRRR